MRFKIFILTMTYYKLIYQQRIILNKVFGVLQSLYN